VKCLVTTQTVRMPISFGARVQRRALDPCRSATHAGGDKTHHVGGHARCVADFVDHSSEGRPPYFGCDTQRARR